MTDLDAPLTLQIRQIRREATGIHSFELVAPDHERLPPFTAGAHIDVHLPGGLVRQYSLCNDPAEAHRYVIGVLKDVNGRGGSLRVHEALKVGDTVRVSRPRNQFELRPEQTSALLIAGGIGITPLKSMAHSLLQAGTPFELHYCARSSEVAAFTEELVDLNHRAPGSARWHFDNGQVGAGLDLAALLAVQPEGTHLYFCGPPGFMKACAQAAAHWPPGTVHSEHFQAPTRAEPLAPATGALVRLSQSARELVLPDGGNLLELLSQHGIHVPTSCVSGLCGTCKTGYSDGEVEHNDFILGDDEKASCLTPCVSRITSRSITLHL
ncbi:MAG: PDR/VanB family oxidoreductase [Hydrogenophaga sp.]